VSSVQPNDIGGLLTTHRRIELIAFNGGTAATLFRRLVARELPASVAAIPRVTLPSTSPAHAARSYAEKQAAWRDALAPVLGSPRPVPR
jgi:G:T/U-mismatch repair DNA glycosylase